MKIFNKTSLKTEENSNVYWASMSDLFLGLLVFFITLFSLAMIGFTKPKIEKQNVQKDITQELIKDFKKNKFDVEVDKTTGTVKISDIQLFKLNEWKLSPEGKGFLDKFVPIYLKNTLGNQKTQNHISNIIVEGHTDSQSFKNIKDKKENYLKNLDLSMKRAYSVSEYIIRTQNKQNYSDTLVKLLSTNGKSYSEPVITKGKEDFTKSRRVELKFQVK